eukprot:4415308-Prymnesium_polylepis.1
MRHCRPQTSSTNGLPIKDTCRSRFSFMWPIWSLKICWSQLISLLLRSSVCSCCSGAFLKFSQPSCDVSESGRVPIRLLLRSRWNSA